MMEFKISVMRGETYVHSRVCEPLTEEVLTELMSATAQKADEWGFNKFLVDLREAPLLVHTVSNYEFAYDKSKRLGFKVGSKHALIVRPDDLSEFGFVETVFNNAGFRLRVFLEETDAIEWLEE